MNTNRCPRSGARHRALGFTLIELLVAIGIVAILARVAIPSYKEFIARAARADAQLVLLQAANSLERQYSHCNSFLVVDASTAPPCRTAAPALATELRQSPVSGRRKYTITLAERTAQFYELQATPVDTTDPCGTFVLRSTGERRVSGGRWTVAQCWRR